MKATANLDLTNSTEPSGILFRKYNFQWICLVGQACVRRKKQANDTRHRPEPLSKYSDFCPQINRKAVGRGRPQSHAPTEQGEYYQTMNLILKRELNESLAHRLGKC